MNNICSSHLKIIVEVPVTKHHLLSPLLLTPLTLDAYKAESSRPLVTWTPDM
jgi:hypothetical protein